MFSRELIALPVLAALFILSLETNLAQAGDVRLFNYTREEIDIGDISSHTTTANELRRMIVSKSGIDLDSLRLVTVMNNTLVEGDQLLSEYISITEGQLFLWICDDLTEIDRVNVYFADHRIGVMISKEKTLGWLKKDAVGKLNNPDFYRVFFQGQELTDETKTLGELKFYKEADVIMYKDDDEFWLTVVPQVGNNLNLKVTLQTSVDDLRRMINESGVDLENQLLVHNGKVLLDGTNLFSHSMPTVYDDYRVNVVERIALSGDKITLFQRKPQGIEHFGVLVKPTTTIGELKKFAFKADRSILISEMQLKLNKLSLDDDSLTLDDYNIYPGAWIQVSRKIGT